MQIQGLRVPGGRGGKPGLEGFLGEQMFELPLSRQASFRPVGNLSCDPGNQKCGGEGRKGGVCLRTRE